MLVIVCDIFFLFIHTSSFFFFFFLMIRRPPRSTLFPTRRSSDLVISDLPFCTRTVVAVVVGASGSAPWKTPFLVASRSGEHTSGIQSLAFLVCRLFL